jgi:hypothetical protein
MMMRGKEREVDCLAHGRVAGMIGMEIGKVTALPSIVCPGREIIGTRQSAVAILAASNIAPTYLCLVDYQVLSSRATIHFLLAKCQQTPSKAPCRQ